MDDLNTLTKRNCNHISVVFYDYIYNFSDFFYIFVLSSTIYTNAFFNVYACNYDCSAMCN